MEHARFEHVDKQTITQAQRDDHSERLRERERHRDTETQRHRDAETQRRRDAETQRRRDTETIQEDPVTSPTSLLLRMSVLSSASAAARAAVWQSAQQNLGLLQNMAKEALLINSADSAMGRTGRRGVQRESEARSWLKDVERKHELKVVNAFENMQLLVGNPSVMKKRLNH